jgi:hypothetical protein
MVAAFTSPEESMIEVNEQMLAYVKGVLPDGDWAAPVEAETILAGIDQDLLERWLHANARQFVIEMLSHLRHQERASAFHLRTMTKRASTFAKYQEGEASVFDMRFVVNDAHVSRRLGDMTRDDLVYVRDRYLATAADAETKATFLEELAQATPPGQTVSEAMAENTVRDVLTRYFKPETSAA